jgi:hypothetical protein
VPGDDWATAHDLRNRMLVTLMKRFAAEDFHLSHPDDLHRRAGRDAGHALSAGPTGRGASGLSEHPHPSHPLKRAGPFPLPLGEGGRREAPEG